MPFIMIVVTTSWAPVFTFRMPGTAAQIIPPSIAAIRTRDHEERPREEAQRELGPGGRDHRDEVLALDPDVEHARP